MKDWQWGFGVHVMGPVHGIKAFVPRMIEQDGEGFVVNTTSAMARCTRSPTRRSTPRRSRLTSLTEVLYGQLKEKAPHIKVGILFPGPRLVNTGLLDSPRPDEYRDPSNPLPKGVAMSDLAQRMGGVEMTEPDDVAAYCSNASRRTSSGCSIRNRALTVSRRAPPVCASVATPEPPLQGAVAKAAGRFCSAAFDAALSDCLLGTS